MGITGVDTRVTVKTLDGEISHMTTVVENLKVTGSLVKPKWIKPPRAYTKQELPLDEQEIATPEIGGIIWKELQMKFTPTIDISVELLIGANCAETLEPKEVISSRENSPYAVKTILGWCVVGLILCTSESGDKVN